MFLFSPFSYLGNDPSWFNHSCKSEGTPPMPSPPRHKALSRVDYPPSSPTRAILRLYFRGGRVALVGTLGTLCFPWTTNLYSPFSASFHPSPFNKNALPSKPLVFRKSWHCLKWWQQRPPTRRWRRGKQNVCPKKWAALGLLWNGVKSG